MNERTTSPNLGDLISTLYAAFFAEYGDEEIASVATAVVVNDLLAACGAGEALS